MEIPNIKIGDLIKIGSHFGAPKAKVVQIYSKEDKEISVFGDIEVVYYQNKIKGIKEDAVWDGENWKFKNDGPSGSYVNIDDYPELKN